MAMTADQVMMFAHLADWVGSRMAPDNPFAGYAQQFVGARNYANMLQPGATPGAPGAAPTGEAPAAEPSAIAQQSPFDPGYQPLQLPEKAPSGASFGGADLSGIMNPQEMDIRDLFMTPGMDVKSDADNNITMSRKMPAQTQAGAPAKKEAPQQQQNLPSSVTNPFWFLG